MEKRGIADIQRLPYSIRILVENLLRKLDNRAFNRFLRDRIGCVYDASREITPIGSARLPAGYMVPVQCTGPAA